MKILVTDDIFTNRLLLSEIIEDLGHKHLEAENGKIAIEMLLEHDDIDMVLMDIEMPVMNGIEATKHIRNFLGPSINNIPVVALTAHNPKIFFDDYKDVGFDQLLTKPYSVQKIMNLLESFNVMMKKRVYK
jgi:CheY-like chemotaxis protein